MKKIEKKREKEGEGDGEREWKIKANFWCRRYGLCARCTVLWAYVSWYIGTSMHIYAYHGMPSNILLHNIAEMFEIQMCIRHTVCRHAAINQRLWLCTRFNKSRAELSSLVVASAMSYVSVFFCTYIYPSIYLYIHIFMNPSMYIVLTREISFAQCLRQLHRQGQIFVCMKFRVCVCVVFFCVHFETYARKYKQLSSAIWSFQICPEIFKYLLENCICIVINAYTLLSVIQFSLCRTVSVDKNLLIIRYQLISIYHWSICHLIKSTFTAEFNEYPTILMDTVVPVLDNQIKYISETVRKAILHQHLV